MKRSRYIVLSLAAPLPVFAVIGCQSCPELVPSYASPATLTVNELATLPADAVQDAQTYSVSSVTTVQTVFSDVADPQQLHDCLEVSIEGNPYVFQFNFDCPSGPGTYLLSQLHATGNLGAPFDGTLVVRAITRPCGQGACGRFDADLDFPMVDAGGGPWISGHAKLSYSERIVEGSQYCGSFGAGG
jgi:hypothetical protein